MHSFNDIWKLVLDELSNQTSPTSVGLWFSGLKLAGLDSEHALLLSEDNFRYKILTAKYLDLLCRAFEKVVGFPVDVMIIDKEDSPAEYTRLHRMLEHGSANPEVISLPTEKKSGKQTESEKILPDAVPSASAPTEKNADKGKSPSKSVKSHTARPSAVGPSDSRKAVGEEAAAVPTERHLHTSRQKEDTRYHISDSERLKRRILAEMNGTPIDNAADENNAGEKNVPQEEKNTIDLSEFFPDTPRDSDTDEAASEEPVPTDTDDNNDPPFYSIPDQSVKIKQAADDDKEKDSVHSLGPSEYTFDNFIVGSSNKFAHAASIAVAKDPANKNMQESYAYNPLFIYGPSGLGKTHLMYAIMNYIKQTRPELKIVYVKGEEFTNQLIDSIAKRTSERFREKYRKADILLIDDIQFIAGRDSTQEEFFHTFNALYEDHRQIILTSDRPPRDIKTLEDRLKSRFEWGITADIQPPDADLRAAILKKKSEQMNIPLTSDVVNYLAENLKSNIRQVEGAVKKLGALSLLTGTPITVELARNSIADLMTGGESVTVTIDRILEKTARKYGITVDDIKGSKRTKVIAYARHISIYTIRKMTDMSLPQIGRLFNRDHTTILSSLKLVEKEIGSSSSFDIDVADLMKEIKG